MVLRKLSKKVIYGSTLLGHYGVDITDVTSSSATFVNWGASSSYRPVHGDSNMEVTVTGSAFQSGNNRADTQEKSKMQLLINGEVEYIQVALGHMTSGIGALTRHYYNPRFNQHNARQQFHASNFGTGVYMSTIYAPGNTNQITFECEAASTNSMTVQWTDGYMTVTEISGPGYNLT